jgi:hypothetical protein
MAILDIKGNKLMKMAIALLFVMSAHAKATIESQTTLEEKLYYSYQESILNQKRSLSGFTQYDQSIYVDALSDLVDEKTPEALNELRTVTAIHFQDVEKLRVEILKLKHQIINHLDQKFEEEILNALKMPSPNAKLIYTLATYEKLLLITGHDEMVSLAKASPLYENVNNEPTTLADSVIKDIFDNDVKYDGAKLFMFCRHYRNYPCLMLMRDKNGEIFRNEDGTTWTHLALASSKKGLPSSMPNGHTPTGVMRINGVMPVADLPVAYGKFRRMILNFVPKSQEENEIKKFLPESSLSEKWWVAGTVARDIDRRYLRIHGTGIMNWTPKATYYPFIQTSGCIAQRENTYKGVSYQDQRILLDSLMTASGLQATYENEPKIKALLYIVNIDEKLAPVTLEDLISKGVL